MKAIEYQFSSKLKPDTEDDPGQAELEYIIPFLPEIMIEMNRAMSTTEE